MHIFETEPIVNIKNNHDQFRTTQKSNYCSLVDTISAEKTLNTKRFFRYPSREELSENMTFPSTPYVRNDMDRIYPDLSNFA